MLYLKPLTHPSRPHFVLWLAMAQLYFRVAEHYRELVASPAACGARSDLWHQACPEPTHCPRRSQDLQRPLKGQIKP
jgi:hypothetical protein